MQDASYVCTCDRSGNRVTRGCGRTGMSAGVRKGAKWVGDCGWLSLGRGEILKRSSIHGDIGDWKILHGIYGVHVVAPAILWRGVVGKICRFWDFSISKEKKVRKGGWKSNGKRRNVEMSQGAERWKALVGLSLTWRCCTYYYSSQLLYVYHCATAYTSVHDSWRTNQMMTQTLEWDWFVYFTLLALGAQATEGFDTSEISVPTYVNTTRSTFPDICPDSFSCDTIRTRTCCKLKYLCTPQLALFALWSCQCQAIGCR